MNPYEYVVNKISKFNFTDAKINIIYPKKVVLHIQTTNITVLMSLGTVNIYIYKIPL